MTNWSNKAAGQATRFAVWAFPLIAGKEDRPPEDAQSQEDEKVGKNE